jgi:hypothetical protein
MLMAVPSSTSRASICDRLMREGRPDLVAAIENGRVSAFAIGVAMGWKKRQPITGRGPTNRAKRRDAIVAQLLGTTKASAPATESDDELSLRDAVELSELCFGPDQTGSVFATREELRAAWVRHRAAAMAVMQAAATSHSDGGNSRARAERKSLPSGRGSRGTAPRPRARPRRPPRPHPSQNVPARLPLGRASPFSRRPSLRRVPDLNRFPIRATRNARSATGCTTGVSDLPPPDFTRKAPARSQPCHSSGVSRNVPPR